MSSRRSASPTTARSARGSDQPVRGVSRDQAEARPEQRAGWRRASAKSRRSRRCSANRAKPSRAIPGGAENPARDRRQSWHREHIHQSRGAPERDAWTPDDALPCLRSRCKSVASRERERRGSRAQQHRRPVHRKASTADAQTHFERALQLREKANAPRDMADTVHNLAETLLKWGASISRSPVRARARLPPKKRRQARRRDRVVQHRHDLRLSGPLRRRGEVEGRGAGHVSRPEAARHVARRDPRRLRQQSRLERTIGRSREAPGRGPTVGRELHNPA